MTDRKEPSRSISTQRRRRLRNHLVPVAALGLVAFVAGAIAGAGGSDTARSLTAQYARAWSRWDLPGMYRLLDASSRLRISEAELASEYRQAATTATMTTLAIGAIGSTHDGVVPVRTIVRTRMFGTLSELLQVPVSGSGTAAGVHFEPALVFPGLRDGEQLTRQAVLAPRAALLASDGSALAQGRQRSSAIPDVSAQIAGVLGPIPSEQADTYAAEGYPPGAQVGLDGLERIFESRLAGTPGGTLIAGTRVLAQRAPSAGSDVKTTIDPRLERAAVAAIAGRYAGVIAMDPRTGAVLAAAGVGFSALQPPGSTMKIMTATGLLQAGLVRLGEVFPYATGVTIDGFPMHNANGESCGGTLINAFANSCNSVFAPLGVKLGASRLVATANRFGFNQPSPIFGEPASTIPASDVASSDLELGSSAIGQGQVQATTLEMTDVAATIAMKGQRPIPTLLTGQRPAFVSVTTPRVAAKVQRMMLAVVSYGTGTAAQISGVQVAGKTGTAELRDTVNPNDPNAKPSPQNTDAWFVAYAPARAPRIVVGALFPGQGAGGTTAAPAAAAVLLAGLRR